MRLLMGFRKPFVAMETALRNVGCELLPWPPGTALPDLTGVDAALVDLPDAARNLLAVRRLRRTLARRGPIIGLDRDSPWFKGVKARRLRLLSWLGLLDIHAAHSLQAGKRFAPKTLYLANAAWPAVYNLRGRTLAELRRPETYRHDVSFLGNLDADRYPEHRERVRLLDTLARRLTPEGIHLECFDSTAMSIAEQVAIIQTSRINLNLGAACDNAGIRSWGLPERCYGVPACGGFLLSDRRLHAPNDFVPGREWVDFADLDDCVAKIRHYLAHFDTARLVAEAAHRRVLTDHTYDQRAATLLRAITEWRQDEQGP